MGLDITAYSHLVYLGPYKDGYHDQYIDIYGYEAFNRLDGLAPGAYAPTERTRSFSFRAGPYSAYNRWREALCRCVLQVEPRQVWHNPEAYVGRPFVELIHFSDCEGAIGPRTSQKLMQDCAQLLRTDVGFPLLESWQKTFILAAQDGFVKFH